ncbi:MAG TPA: sensor histidine kinase, partial [Aquamicrobium sp.]|nr:sensor histidine kinase [Aquamicrobium sp.]
MAEQRPTSIDKNIVDRTRARRNSEVARAVRRTRDRLSERAGNPVYDRELIKLHADASARTVLAIPLLVLAICIGGLFVGVGPDIGLWATVT